MPISTLTKKGQVTIPKEIRDILGVKGNDGVMFFKKDGDIIVKRVKGDIFDLRGTLRHLKKSENLENIRKIIRKSIAKKIIKDPSMDIDNE
jgi:AbrB family looped-hinge helix DNA binding protein